MVAAGGDWWGAHHAVRPGHGAGAAWLGGAAQHRGGHGGQDIPQLCHKFDLQCEELGHASTDAGIFSHQHAAAALHPAWLQGFYEVYSGSERSFKVARLAPGVRYTFRIMV